MTTSRTRSARCTDSSAAGAGRPSGDVRAARGLDDLTWCLVESRDFAELALAADSWPHGMDSALLFG
ncbi:hypothetical protein, partial [Streptomyces sp. WAC05950]|uniref:hypothetical protein n=1 Tax=Streptomyces sp. WAC05950 TaxID=2487419 RepID=UPI0021CCC11A